MGVGVELDVVGLGDGRILASVCQFLSLQIRGFVRTHSRCRPRTREAVHGVVVEDIIVGGRCFLWALRDTHFFLCGWNYGKSWSKCMIKGAIAPVLCYMLPCSGQQAGGLDA